MGSAFAAGAGADFLQQVLRQKFAEALALKHLGLDEQRLQLDQQRADNETAYRNESLQSLIGAREAAAQGQRQLGAERVASTLAPGAAVDPSTLATLQAGDLGGLVQHKDATLGSTNLSGVASTAGRAPRILGLAKTANPGQEAQDIFQGTAAQQQSVAREKQRQLEVEQGRQDRMAARQEAQQAHEDNIRLTASLRQQPNPQPQMFYDQQTGAPRAVRFVNGQAQEVPLPGGMVKTAPTRMSPQIAEKVAGIDASLHQLDKLEGMYPQVGSKVGPLAGRFNDLKQALPGSSGDPLFASFKAETDTMKNATIKAITGAQMSEKEATRILSQVPLETDQPEVWRQKAKATRDNLAFLRSKIGSMYPQAVDQTGGAGAPPKTGGFSVVEIK